MFSFFAAPFFLILGPHFPTGLDRGGAAPSNAARPRDADRDGDIKITITVKEKQKDDERDGRKQWNPPPRFVAAAYACVRMSHRERRVLPPPLPLQLCGEEELKKKRTGLTDSYLIWMLCYGTQGMSGQMYFFFFLRDSPCRHVTATCT